MTTFFKNILFILYNYYNKGATQPIAYQRTIFAFLIVLFLNLLTLLAFLKIEFSIPFFDNSTKIFKYLIVIFLGFPIFFIVKKIFPKKEIEEYKPNLNYKLSISLFFIYIVISFLLFVVAIKRG